MTPNTYSSQDSFYRFWGRSRMVALLLWDHTESHGFLLLCYDPGGNSSLLTRYLGKEHGFLSDEFFLTTFKQRNFSHVLC